MAGRGAPARAGAASTAALAATSILFFTALLPATGVDRAEARRYVGTGPAKAGHYDSTEIWNGRKTGYADGAPPGFSGGFGEQSCHGCHFSAEPNTPPGQVTLEGVPASFTSGEQYAITIALSRPGMKLGGFQLAARFKDGGAQAGSLAAGPSDGERVKIETQGAIQYASQTRMGADVSGSDPVRWTIVWTAPGGAQQVEFRVSANAADGDESAQGDYVYTATAESAPYSGARLSREPG